jgi:ACS family hexuronate transporter-like MFS transporter
LAKLKHDKLNRITGYQWLILALLFTGTTINYLDRIVLSVLLPEIEKEITISPFLYGLILGSFQFTYTLGLLGIGYIIDKLGTKIGYLLTIIAWSISSAFHGLCLSASCLALWRAAFGLSASGNFPAAIKSVSEWFTVEKRAFATALFNSGSSIASIIGAPLIIAVMINYGWRWTFVIFAASGLFLVVFWQGYYKKSVPVNQSEDFNKLAWPLLLKKKQTLGIMIGKFLTDPVWWFYLYWMPTYLNTEHSFDLRGIALAIPVIYIIAILMGFIGGWVPGYLMRHGWALEKARKTTMMYSALFLPFTVFAVFAENPWTAILLVGLACGAHNSWSANIFTMCSDCFRPQTVGSVTGIAGFAGGFGGVLLSALIPGIIVQYFGYIPVFILMGILHPLAYLFINYLVDYEEAII